MDRVDKFNEVMRKNCEIALGPVLRLYAYLDLKFLIRCYEGGYFDKDGIASEIYYKLTQEYKLLHKHCWALCA